MNDELRAELSRYLHPETVAVLPNKVDGLALLSLLGNLDGAGPELMHTVSGIVDELIWVREPAGLASL